MGGGGLFLTEMGRGVFVNVPFAFCSVYYGEVAPFFQVHFRTYVFEEENLVAFPS
jgi:hypothetical protein